MKMNLKIFTNIMFKVGLSLLVLVSHDLIGGRGIPDGTIPIKAAGRALIAPGSVSEETFLIFSEMGQTDLGESAGFDCSLNGDVLKLRAKGQLKLGKDSFLLDGICISEDKVHVEYLLEDQSLKGKFKNTRRGKVFNGDITIDEKSYRVKLKNN